YRSIHQAVGELIEAENFYIALLSPDGQHLQIPYTVDTAGEDRADRPLGRGLTEYALRQTEPLLIDDAGVRALVERGEIDAEHYGSRRPAVCWRGAPQRRRDGVMGLLAVESERPIRVSAEQDAKSLHFVAQQSGRCLDRRRHSEALGRLNAVLE